jgi:hypothetical protein
VGRERNVVWVVWVNSCHQFFMSSPLHQNRRRRREGNEAIGWEGRRGKGKACYYTILPYNSYDNYIIRYTLSHRLSPKMFAKSLLSAVNRSSVICMRTMATEGKIQGKNIFNS